MIRARRRGRKRRMKVRDLRFENQMCVSMFTTKIIIIIRRRRRRNYFI